MSNNKYGFMEYFKEISKIPRCSGNEKNISDYLMNFAKSLNLEAERDDMLNVVIRKPATKGYEEAPGVILQGHMDMVCEKETSSNHDFNVDPIRIIEENGYLMADRTTLGADDGIAIAMGMAILASDEISHPALELLVTVSEETDMSGALGLSKNFLRGEKLINIDSEEEGILTVGSAGGVTIIATHEILKETVNKPSYSLLFSGLKGGHSGMEIDKNRGNILKVMAYFLSELGKDTEYNLGSFTAGSLDNAIPREGELIVFIDGSNEVFEKAINSTKTEFEAVDGSIEIKVQELEGNTSAWSQNITNDVIKMIANMPTGVNTYVKGSKNVESSNNLASIKEIDGQIYLENSVRSASETTKAELVKKCLEVFEESNFNYKLDMEYPGWEHKENSSFRDLAEKTYLEMYNKNFETIVVHAGLECGAIASKYPNIDVYKRQHQYRWFCFLS